MGRMRLAYGLTAGPTVGLTEGLNILRHLWQGAIGQGMGPAV